MTVIERCVIRCPSCDKNVTIVMGRMHESLKEHRLRGECIAPASPEDKFIEQESLPPRRGK